MSKTAVDQVEVGVDQEMNFVPVGGFPNQIEEPSQRESKISSVRSTITSSDGKTYTYDALYQDYRCIEVELTDSDDYTVKLPRNVMDQMQGMISMQEGLLRQQAQEAEQVNRFYGAGVGELMARQQVGRQYVHPY